MLLKTILHLMFIKYSYLNQCIDYQHLVTYVLFPNPGDSKHKQIFFTLYLSFFKLMNFAINFNSLVSEIINT